MKENFKYGWIGLYRSMTSHWLYPKNRIFTKYEAWIDILLMVNHSEKKLMIGAKLETCEIGETITSQKKLMKRWGWSKSKLINFIKLLESDGMLEQKTTTKKTTIKVLNYQSYQDFNEIEKLKKDHKKTVERLQKDLEKTAKELQKATNNNVNNTNKENKKIIEDRKAQFKELLSPFQSGYEIIVLKDFFEYWTEHGIRDKKMRFEKEKSFSIERRLKTWLKNQEKWEKEKSLAQKEKRTASEAWRELANKEI